MRLRLYPLSRIGRRCDFCEEFALLVRMAQHLHE
jgi:hypothetical protein